ncbi:MAG: DEAD/DEAH box helicase [Bacilli bacterium]
MDLEDLEIVKSTSSNSYYSGKDYPKELIHYISCYSKNNANIHVFNVENNDGYGVFETTIKMSNGIVSSTNCECNEYRLNGHCTHIAACLYNYKKEIFNLDSEQRLINASHEVLTNFYNNTDTSKIKRKINISLVLSFYKKLGNHYLEIKLSIGENKLYLIGNKFRKFFNSYEFGQEDFILGKSYTYEPSSNYFKDEDSEILNYFLNRKKKNNFVFVLRETEIDSFLKLIKNKEFFLEGNSDNSHIINSCPLEISLTKDENKYVFEIQNINEIKIVNTNCNYIIYKNNIYNLPKKISNVLKTMKSFKLNKLLFEEKDMPIFSKGLLSSVKDNIKIDKSIDNIIIGKTPNVKLYFDFKKDQIECIIKLEYNEQIISYFDDVPFLVRDTEFESNAINDLLLIGFTIENKKILLSNMNLITKFLESKIDELSKEYEIFTSQKIKDTSIIDKTHIRSNFTIGKDNIMSYSFSLGDIKSEELSNILDSMKQKKKYYRLKNGNIINTLDNEDLNELSSLIEDMNLSNKDINMGTGTLPKYRAIYLSSLKNNKYNIIDTNNSFDNLINDFNKYKNLEISFKKEEQDVLRDYQLTGVKWLYTIYKCGFGGILADEMGLGKSIELIYLIKLILKSNKDAKILIIAPTSLIYNWKNEFEKFGKEINYKVIAEEKTKRINDLENNNNTNVFITTYGLARQDKEKYLEMNFELLAIDEAQNIKNPGTMITKTIKQLHSKCNIALTGTPIENSVTELWSIFDFIMPGYLNTITSFQKNYHIKDFEEESMNKLSDLNKQITPFILRRKKIDVMKELPPKIENNIYLDLYPKQKEIYASTLNKTKKEMDELIQTEGFLKGRFKILQLLTKLRQICIDPKILYENYEGGSVKIDNLINLLKEIISNNHKILIFTSFRTALEIVQNELNKNDITSYVIDGSIKSKTRMQLVDNFNNDDTNVFLIMLKAGGTGLNLTSADVVIHLDLWWNPQVENQATDRTHRIGQKNTVEVIKLICKGTIEERILELQNKKRILSDSLIEGDNRSQNILSNLTEKDIQTLLSFNEND